MPSDLKVIEDRFIQAMQLRIKQSNETAEELKKLQTQLLEPGHVFIQSYIDDYNNLQDSLNETTARTSALSVALWEFREALNSLPGRAQHEAKVQKHLDQIEAFGPANNAGKEAITFLLKGLL